MILKCLLISAAVLLVCVLLAIKVKKLRALFIVLALLAAVPAGGLGLIELGQGQLLGYPGSPAAAVEGMVSSLRSADYETADSYVLGELGLTAPDTDRSLQALLAQHWAVTVSEEAAISDFTATQTVELTGVDTAAWLTALAEETELTLDNIVQSTNRKEVFNSDGSAYLDGITEQAYQTAYDAMWDKGANYLRTVNVDITLYWTPFGWQISMDEALLGALEGFDTGDREMTTRSGDMTVRLSNRMTTEHGQILENLPLIRKVFTIAQDALQGCVPDPDGFGSTDDPNEVLAVLERAKDLIGDRTISWNPDIKLREGSKVNYYYDETILVLQWKEHRNWTLVTFAEVIVKDGSQIRRVIADNEYRSFAWETPTQMSQRTNAVLGMTGDFYMYRPCGIMVYQGQVYKDNPESLHHLFFTNSGEMLLTSAYEVKKGTAEQYAAENDVNFSLAFGPIIIEDSTALPMPDYLVGEFMDDYPRAAIGEVDPLHFIVMTVGKEGPRENRTVTLPEAQKYILEKGVHKAYALDGGRTANMTFNGELTNDPAYRKERTMSDMFYFATALPEDER